MKEKIYTEKQLETLKNYKKNFFLLILHGAKRSGKTISNNDLFLLELRRIGKIAKEQNIKGVKYILAGNSLGNIHRNVLSELTNKYGISFELNKYNEFTLFGVEVCCFGHGKINDMGRIRGMTAYGAYINEATTGHEQVIREIMNRCSGQGARVLMDTNPDNPEHFIKKDYIDKADGEKIIEIGFNLYDNDFLNKEYIENIEKVTPSGVFWDRDILGLWTTTEGAIYKDFDKNKHIIKNIDDYKFIDYVAGIDWGYEHYGALCLLGITNDKKFILIESIVKQYEEIDFWIGELEKIKLQYGNIKVYADTARPEHIARCRRKSIRMFNADKSVMSGIEKVASLFKQDKLLIYKSNDFLNEVYKYTWNKEKGEPNKKYDDLMDALRYAIYNYKEEKEFKVITA